MPRSSENATPSAAAANADLPASITVENQTPKRLIFEEGDEEAFVLAPFESRAVRPELFEHFNMQALVHRGVLEVPPPPQVRSSDTLVGLIVWLVIAYLAGGFILPGRLTRGTSPTSHWLGEHYWLWTTVVLVVAIVAMIAIHKKRATHIVRIMTQWMTLLVTAALSFGVPALIVYQFGGGKEVLAKGPAGAIVGRGLQLLLIAIGSLLPALMYYLFDRQKLGTLRLRLEQQLVRLDPGARTLRDVRAKYGPQMDEIYGAATTSQSRLVRASRWPILLATILTMAGWMVTLPFFRSFGDTDNVLAYFSPPHSTVVFAFLGAYLYTLNSILRRYVRGDLKPKAYSSISVRIFVVMILAWVIELTIGGPVSIAGTGQTKLNEVTALLLSFLVGIIPESGLTWIQELVRQRLGQLALRIEEKHPLTDLEGIDIYDRGRLLDEGVTNIESLAHFDIVDLILDTRIPVPRIVDWLDQAILYLHISTPYAGLESKDEKEAAVASLRKNLRNHGIRTATDLLGTYQKAHDRNQGPEFLKEMRGDFPAISVEPVQVILDTLVDDEWFDYVRHWRTNRTTEEYRIQSRAQSAQATPDQPSASPPVITAAVA